MHVRPLLCVPSPLQGKHAVQRGGCAAGGSRSPGYDDLLYFHEVPLPDPVWKASCKEVVNEETLGDGRTRSLVNRRFGEQTLSMFSLSSPSILSLYDYKTGTWLYCYAFDS